MEMLQALGVVLLELIVLEGLEELMQIMEEVPQDQAYQTLQLLAEEVVVLGVLVVMELLLGLIKEEMVE